MIRATVRSGPLAGQTYELDQDIVTLGHAADNDIVLDSSSVAAHHLRIVRGASETWVEDLHTLQGTLVTTDGGSTTLHHSTKLRELFESRCSLELGSSPGVLSLVVEVRDTDAAQVMSIRRRDETLDVHHVARSNSTALAALYEAQSKCGGAQDLQQTLQAICDGALALVPGATHATIILREHEDDTSAALIPMLTRIRSSQSVVEAPSPIPIARSIYRKVVTERAAVLAADAVLEVGQTESLLGSAIRSTAAVPLWKGEAITGVLQVDNREAPAMLQPQDLEILSMFSATASLAVSNARLIAELQTVRATLTKENAFLKRRDPHQMSEIIGKSQVMVNLLNQVQRVASTRVTVLIEGETGTGKELLAHAIHQQSPRSSHLFVAQNCASLPESLLESELFGHTKGSFTGAIEDKKGLFDIADGGTLFLDEVGELSMGLQGKLLRVLQEGELRPVGASREHKVDVRVVAATNRKLEKEVREGRFREDLYYRLKVFPLVAPPLRERREDIPLLAVAFLRKYADELSKDVAGIAQQAMELLVAYEWPGNVRELQNELQRNVIQADPGGFIGPELLSARLRNAPDAVERAGVPRGTLKAMVDHVEKFLLLEALERHGHHKTNAAKTLGMTREGLHKKLKSHGIK